MKKVSISILMLLFITQQSIARYIPQKGESPSFDIVSEILKTEKDLLSHILSQDKNPITIRMLDIIIDFSQSHLLYVKYIHNLYKNKESNLNSYIVAYNNFILPLQEKKAFANVNEIFITIKNIYPETFYLAIKLHNLLASLRNYYTVSNQSNIPIIGQEEKIQKTKTKVFHLIDAFSFLLENNIYFKKRIIQYFDMI